MAALEDAATIAESAFVTNPDEGKALSESTFDAGWRQRQIA